jgi:hypothetical protein
LIAISIRFVEQCASQSVKRYSVRRTLNSRFLEKQEPNPA